MGSTAILMYHRICERTPHTEPYFARGTAVEPHIFRTQLEWLDQNVCIRSLDDECSGPTPAVALTFDDGYAETADVVASTCRNLGVPWTSFPVSRFTLEPGASAWVDRYYAVLASARRQSPDLRLLAPDLPGSPPSIDADMRWWVRGPLKRWLFDRPVMERDRAIETLAYLVDSPHGPQSLCMNMYVTLAELRQLHHDGVLVGGHGGSHLRMTGLDAAGVERELGASHTLLDLVGLGSRRFFCYPDGDYNLDVAARVLRSGFKAALTVEPGWRTDQTPDSQWPRFIVRNIAPDQPKWCAAFDARSPYWRVASG